MPALFAKAGGTVEDGLAIVHIEHSVALVGVVVVGQPYIHETGLHMLRGHQPQALHAAAGNHGGGRCRAAGGNSGGGDYYE